MERFDQMKSKVLTVQEVSSYLRVHPSTIYRMLRRHQLPAFRVGSDWRFTVEAIDKWREHVESGISEPAKNHRPEHHGASK
ncbi:MAG: helix-turn-helix domain-containing protein [Candidatus Binatus sp.]|uniref:helix-turn-helix domain-containing protein n=1 Tax=Candidatus Binatus sp. TaxID=2811406 RepID=UPI002723AF62|nr:helix-turn-helix domain-containing protein [Candidatus Binatus sp.]MDO8433564.1 helix-turn-helix domain-containing protein [Candidatus Binatus sp.]